MKKNLLSLIIIFIATLLSFWSVANAQSPAALSVQPSNFHIYLAPGQKVLQSFLLINQSNKQETLKVYTKDYKTSESGAIEFYNNKNTNLSATTWLVPQYTTVTIAPFDSKKIQYIASADKNIPGGGYDGAIIFQAYDNATNSYGKAFGSLVSIDVMTAGITTGGEIKNFSTPAFQYADPTKIGFSVKNIGNSNLYATGTISVYNLLGKKINQFNAGQLNVLPLSSRTFDFQWTDSRLFGIYKTEVSLSSTLGKNNNITSSSWFIVIPWLAILISLLSIAVVFALIKYRKTIFSSKIFRNNGGIKKIKIRNVSNNNETIFSDRIMEISIKELFFAN